MQIILARIALPLNILCSQVTRIEREKERERERERERDGGICVHMGRDTANRI